jgi:hypothetical protein
MSLDEIRAHLTVEQVAAYTQANLQQTARNAEP